MPNYNVILLPLAEKDMAKNTDYIFYDKHAPETALELLNGFRKTIKSLENMPKRHELDEDADLAAREIRKCYYKNYKIYFYINEERKQVFVLRILHMLVNSKPLLLNMD